MQTKWMAGLMAVLMLVACVGTVAAAPAQADRPGATITGEVTAINGRTLTVQRGQQPAVQVLTDAQTRFHARGEAPLTLADIEVGDAVAARGQWQNGQLLARDVLRLADRAGGRVASISGATLVLTQRDGATVTVATNAQTQFRSPEVPEATLADIAVGDIVQATGEQSGSTLTAALVVFNTPRTATGPLAMGKIEAINGSVLTLTIGFGETLTVNTTSETFIVKRGEDGAQQVQLSDLTVGEGLVVIGPRSSDGSSMAARTILAGKAPERLQDKAQPGKVPGPQAPLGARN